MKNNRRIRYERSTINILKKLIYFVISLILLSIQLFLYYLVFIAASKNSWIYLIVTIFGFICVISIFDKKMSSSFKLIWTIIILLFPFVGTILYVLYGNERSFPLYKSKKIHKVMSELIVRDNQLDKIKEYDSVAYKHTLITHYGTDLPVHTNTKTKFYSDIKDKHNDMIKDMKNAKKYIFMEYFIMSKGVLLNEIIDVLKQKGEEGVEIKICYDDFGSKLGLKKKDIKRFKEIPNLEIVDFEPLGLTIKISANYRDHRKLVIVDGNIAYLGGDNIADEYANLKSRFGHWRDNAIRIEGDAVDNCLYSFIESWYLSTKKILSFDKYKFTGESETTNNIVMPFADGPTDRRNPAHDLYTSITNNAKDYLYISTPYFIIDPEFIGHICNACRSGVDVRILVPGIPDKKTVYLLTESHFGEILRAGGKIYKYTPGFNHAKNYICDDKHAVIGSINVDYRSLYLHFENGVYLSNDHTIKEMKEDFLSSLDKSEELTYEKWKKRPLYMKVLQFILKLFSPLM